MNMKKAFSSVFNKGNKNTMSGNNGMQKAKLEESDPTVCQITEYTGDSEDLSDSSNSGVVSVTSPTSPDVDMSKTMKSYNSLGMTSNYDPKQLLQHQLSTSSSMASKKSSQSSHVVHHYKSSNSNDFKYDRQISSERKSSLESSRMQLAIAAKDVADSLSAVCSSPTEISDGEESYETSYETHRKSGSQKTSVTRDGITAEKCMATNEEMRRMKAGDSTVEERNMEKAIKEKMEGNGFSASKSAAMRQNQKQMQIGDKVMQQQTSAKESAMQFRTGDSVAEKRSIETQKAQRAISQGMIQSEQSTSQTSSQLRNSISSNKRHQMIDGANRTSLIYESFSPNFMALLNEVDTEFNFLSGFPCSNSSTNKIHAPSIEFKSFSKQEKPKMSQPMTGSMAKIERKMTNLVDQLKKVNDSESEESIEILSIMNDMIRKAWSVPSCGDDLGFNLCSIIRKTGGLNILIQNCKPNVEPDVQFLSAQLLEQCLTTENRDFVVANGLTDVITVARECINTNSACHAQVGTGILEHMFKHSEDTCKDIIAMDGLKCILYECRSADIDTLRHCASALANLSLYGGHDSQVAMIENNAPVWLFPLAFHNDDNIQYYACLAIAVLVANKEVEAAVLNSGTLNLVEPFVSRHNPQEFATSSTSHIHGQSKDWLRRLVPVLDSKREEARSLAAFHFAMEAWIKKHQGNTSVFKEIGAVEALKKAASCPNAIVSKYAAQALRLIGEEVPHKLSQQVPLWTIEDVREWVKQIGFSQFINEFVSSRVDGDLLLQLNEDMLKDDIGIKNGILRKRFLRELGNLKRITDYSSCDNSNLNGVLNSLGNEYMKYAYSMLMSGIDTESLHYLDEDCLKNECQVDNSIHRHKILNAIKGKSETLAAIEDKPDEENKTLDVFISYRRSNGSQLASLLKVHLQLRGFTVFIDVERLEAGKFDCNLLNNIKQAKHFILVLTPNALERCVSDDECKDWVHKEIVQALQSKCNIIPIMDNFQWPETETLPEDMKAVSYFNGVRWIHDYQDACVDKLERFMRGELNTRSNDMVGPIHNRFQPVSGTPGSATPVVKSPMSIMSSPYQRSGSNDSGKSNEPSSQ